MGVTWDRNGGPSRLHRALGLPSWQDALRVELASFLRNPDGSAGGVVRSGYQDGYLASVRHQTECKPFGQPSATATVVVATDRTFTDLDVDMDLTVTMTDAGVAALEALIGTGDYRARWFGRVRNIAVRDNGPTNNHRTTTFEAGSWLSMLTVDRSRAVADQSTGSGVDVLVKRMVTDSKLPMPISTPTGNRAWPTVYPATGPVAWSDLMDKYTADLGAYWRQGRDGSVTLFNQSFLEAYAFNTPNDLPRTLVVRPVEWDAGNHERHLMDVSYRLASNPSATTGFGVGMAAGLHGSPADVTKVDLTHVAIESETVADRIADAMMHAYTTRYRLRTATVDVLLLLALAAEHGPSSRPATFARWVLEAEPGAPVKLTNEWPDTLPGYYFLTSVEHTITAGEWRVTFDLTDAGSMVGLNFGAGASVPGTTWDTYFDHTMTWDRINETQWEALP